ncbi:MAG: DJ-1/PfpI family protein [Acidobacteriota bacterium]|nr:DJ-1/PfpI family protein [Acidobacteriota bacterium]
MNRQNILFAVFAAFLSLIAAARPLPHYQPRPGHTRPLIAVLGYNGGTETTDYIVPYGILAESGVADVVALSNEPGPMQMLPALRIRAQATLAEFDSSHPGGADYVIVPNLNEGSDKPEILQWVRTQSQRGATIVGVCDGVVTVANAGLLDGRTATGHWHTIEMFEKKRPATRWVRNRRYVADGNVITTSGVTASIPISLALIEAIAGPEHARTVAARLHVADWSDTHDSSEFHLGSSKVFTALANKFLHLNDQLGIRVAPGVDEISLALATDAYSRTYRSLAFAVGDSTSSITTKHGLTLLPDRTAADAKHLRMLPPLDRLPAADALDCALAGIRTQYGETTAALVALQIEYPTGR